MKDVQNRGELTVAISDGNGLSMVALRGGNGMDSTSCPYCREDIKADAILCRHCHTSLPRTREEMVMAEIDGRLVPPPAITSGSVSEAFCRFKFGSDRVALQECLNDAKAAQAAVLLAERLHRELSMTFLDVVWGGGDIDPLPLEKSVRERFSRPPDKG